MNKLIIIFSLIAFTACGSTVPPAVIMPTPPVVITEPNGGPLKANTFVEVRRGPYVYCKGHIRGVIYKYPRGYYYIINPLECFGQTFYNIYIPSYEFIP